MKAQVLLLAVLLFVGLSSFKNSKKNNNEAMDLNTSITGLIVDQNSGEALVGVEVQLEGSKLKTYTDFDGKFSFDNVSPGAYKVSTSYISYENSESRNININKNEMHTLNLNLKTANK